MSLHVIPFNEKDHYETLVTWWDSHKFSAPPVHALPRTGVVVVSNETPVAAGFLYKTDSCIAWMEFIISNPKSDRMLRSEALDILMDCLCNLAKTMGFKTVFTSSNLPKFIERNEKHNFVAYDKGVTHLLRSL